MHGAIGARPAVGPEREQQRATTPCELLCGYSNSLSLRLDLRPTTAYIS